MNGAMSSPISGKSTNVSIFSRRVPEYSNRFKANMRMSGQRQMVIFLVASTCCLHTRQYHMLSPDRISSWPNDWMQSIKLHGGAGGGGAAA